MKPLSYTDLFDNSVAHPAVGTASIVELCAGAWRRSNFPESCGEDICHLERNGCTVKVWLKSEMESTEFRFPTEDGAKEAAAELDTIWKAAGGSEGGPENEQHVAWESVLPRKLIAGISAKRLTREMSAACYTPDATEVCFGGDEDTLVDRDLERDLLAMQEELRRISTPNNQVSEFILALAV